MTEKKCAIYISSPPIKGDKNTNWVEFAGKASAAPFSVPKNPPLCSITIPMKIGIQKYCIKY